MERFNIGVRTLDIQSGLYKFQDPLIDMKLRRTILIGKAASLASHLRGLQVIENYEGLIVLASKLGISSIELERVLEILDEIRYIKVLGSKDQPDRIEVLLSVFETTYERLGEKWQIQKPAEFEQKMVELIDKLTYGVLPSSTLPDSYDLNRSDMSTLMDLGTQGGLISTFQRGGSGEEMLYSPLYMEENPTQVIEMLSKHSEKDVKEALDILKKMPGLPIVDLNKITNIPLLELMKSNVYQTPAIKASGGQVNFLFSPFTETEDKQMLRHSRYVVAAVRYGQKFSTYSNLKMPLVFLDQLIDKGYIGKTPHSDIEAQYGALRDCGLGRIEEVIPGRYRFHLADTKYAKNVVKLARKILSSNTDIDPEISRGIVEEAWNLRGGLSQYQFNDYIPNLNNIQNVKRVLKEKDQLRRSSNSQKLVNSMLNTLFTGGEPDVF